MEPPETRIETPQELYTKALEERKSSNRTTRKEACEKGWLAVTRALDPFLAERTGIFPKAGEAEAHKDRNRALGRLADIDPDQAWKLTQLVSTVKEQLHGACFYAGVDNAQNTKILEQDVREILSLTGHAIEGTGIVREAVGGPLPKRVAAKGARKK